MRTKAGITMEKPRFIGKETDRELDKGQQPGDILLFCRPKGFSLLISWLTHSSYYHVAICNDTTHVVESRPGGVILRDLQSKKGGHIFEVIPAPEGSGARALEWARAQIGDGYDGKDVIVLLLDRIFTHLHINYRAHNGKYTCAEFVAKAFEEAGVRLIPDEKTEDVLPKDFARLLDGKRADKAPSS